MTTKFSALKKIHQVQSSYSQFDKLDGSHDWQTDVPFGYIPYQVRELQSGKVAYFNFALAKEMGLLKDDHPTKLNAELEEKLIQTFAIQIINEYDLENKRKFPSHLIKPNPYMATRYLQLQHADKTGKTSGDGRGIWNGQIRHQGVTWDVSSRGTGVTRLAPGAVIAKRPLKTGGNEFGYGCGQAEVDELLGAALSAEVMHVQGINTERVLCIIDLGRGVGIGVRAAKNLFRPAHLFLYLKQGLWDEAKAATDFLLQRQIENKAWSLPDNRQRYSIALRYIASSFARFAARLESEYVFAWLDWDGDNVLADAGIIDYGSIRQFGIRHDQYRYDDVERFSTNLNEQKAKARLTVQVFAQLFDFIKTGEKKPLSHFRNDPVLKYFDSEFETEKLDRLLFKFGYSATQRKLLLKICKKKVISLDQAFSQFERAKVNSGIQKVPDGINLPALFNARKFVSLINNPEPAGEFNVLEILQQSLSKYAKRRDRKRVGRWFNSALSIHKTHSHLLKVLKLTSKQRKELCLRAERVNNGRRITGNALIQIVDLLLTEKKKGLPLSQIQALLDRMIQDHFDLPEANTSEFHLQMRALVPAELMARVNKIILECREEI